MKACCLPILPITFTVYQNRVSLYRLLVSWHRPWDLTKCIAQDLHAVLWPLHGSQVLPTSTTCPNQQSVLHLCAECTCHLAHNTCPPEWRFGTPETASHGWDTWTANRMISSTHVPQSFSARSCGRPLKSIPMEK